MSDSGKAVFPCHASPAFAKVTARQARRPIVEGNA